MEDHSEAMLGAIEGVFGDRLKRSKPGRPAADGALASVFPTSADEVALLARLAERYSVPLTALGAETAQDKPAKEGRILVRFDLMRGLWLSEEPWAEAEPGALWLELDNDLRVRGRGLTAEMAQPRALGEEYMLFGAYPGERSAAFEDAIKEVASSTGGSLLPPAEAYRAWGERFFPIAPSHPTPVLAERAFVALTEVRDALESHAAKAVQGTVAGSGEVLLLAFDPHDENRG